MNDLHSVMQMIDVHSGIIPEGDYLSLCNHLKNVFNELNNKVENTLPLTPPLSERQMTRIRDISRRIERLKRALNKKRTELKKNANWVRMTPKRQIEAIGDYMKENYIIGEVSMATLEENSHRIVNHDLFYKNYMNKRNGIARCRRHHIENSILTLEEDIDSLEEDRNLIRFEDLM